MTRITGKPVSTTVPRPKSSTAQSATTKTATAWAAKASDATARRAAATQQAPASRKLLASYAAASNAETQAEMVGATRTQNDAIDGLLRQTGDELVAQLRSRGDAAGAKKVEANLKAFSEKLGPASDYYVDPERGSMAGIEDNRARLKKLTAQLGKLTDQLEKVADEPKGESQADFIDHARTRTVVAEARLAVALELGQQTDGGMAAVSVAQKSFKTLEQRIEKSMEEMGGSMEVIQRKSALARELETLAARVNELAKND